MLTIKENFSIKELNTFGLDAICHYFVALTTDEDIEEYLVSDLNSISKRLIIGSGSNLLFTNNFDGVIIKADFRQIKKIKETDKFVTIKVGGGIIWDEFVAHAVRNNWGGIENLSDIPGTVGAAPVQNIGAYGVESKDTLVCVEGINLKTREHQFFSKEDCQFEYRNSIFKKQHKNDFLITHVHFELAKNPELVTHYGSIEEELKDYDKHDIRAVREVICKIRQSKLPDIRELGNAGSFFKNPVIPIDQFNSLVKNNPDIPSYKVNDQWIKVPAAWLIEHSGLKGYRIGNVGTHINQPLVIVNYGGASGTEVVDFSRFIQNRVNENYNIQLEPEVNFI